MTAQEGCLLLRSADRFYKSSLGVSNNDNNNDEDKYFKSLLTIFPSFYQVSAAKYARAERELKSTRPLGDGAKQFYENAEIPEKEVADKKPQKLYVAITSDRGKYYNIFILKLYFYI